MYRTGHKHWVQKMANAPRTKWFTSWFSGISQGLDYVYLTLMVVVVWFAASSDNKKVMIVGLSITIARMILMFIMGLITCIAFRNPLGWAKILKNKEGWFITIGGVIGGGLGTVFSNLAVIFAGESLGGILTSIFPIFVALVSRKLFKEKIKKWGWIGLGISIISMTSISLLKYFQGSSEEGTKIIIGLIFGLLTSVTFATESILVEWGTRNSKIKINNYCSITMVGFSASILLLIILPFWTKIVTNNWVYGFDQLGRIVSEGKTFGWVLGSATIFSLSWWSYYHAIDKMGSTDATSICVTYTLWTPIIASLIYIPSFINNTPLVDAHNYGLSASELIAYNKQESLNFMERIGWAPFVFAPFIILGIVLLLRNVENGIDKAEIKLPRFLSRRMKQEIRKSWDD